MQKTEGIILRRQEIRETSLLLVVFTRRLGKIHGLVKGVRGARAAVPWYLDPLTLQSLVLYERRRSPWVLISSCDLLDAFDPIRRDFLKTAYAAYGLDLVDALTGISDSHPEIFELLLHVLHTLEKGPDLRACLRYLEAHLLRISGLLPEPASLALSVPAKEALTQILRADSSAGLTLPAPVEAELRVKLQALLRGVLERELRSRSFLQALGLENAPRVPVAA